jgi:hypothetical protein
MPSFWAERFTSSRLSWHYWHGWREKQYGGEGRAIEEDLLKIFGGLVVVRELEDQKSEGPPGSSYNVTCQFSFQKKGDAKKPPYNPSSDGSCKPIQSLEGRLTLMSTCLAIR